jgi:hypothetical protein
MGEMNGRGNKLSPEVAAAVALAVGSALAAAHVRRIVHGAVHPRSVFIDDTGRVRLGDFAVGAALGQCIAHGGDSALWRGLSGFVAPEVVLGEAPGPASDVYSTGALLFAMLTGQTPPGSLTMSPAVVRVVQRALDTDPGRRYPDGGEFLAALREAFEDDRWIIADGLELSRLVGSGAAASENLDDSTEDLLASLSLDVGRTVTRPSTDLRAVALAARQQQKSRDEDAGKLEDLLADLDEAPAASAQPARVEPPASRSDEIPLSIDEPVTSPVARAKIAAPVPLMPVAPATPAAAPPAPAAEAPVARPVPVAVARPVVVPAGIDDVAPVPRLRRSYTWLWILIIVGTGAGIAVLYQKHAEQSRRLKAESTERQRQADELSARLAAERPDPGGIRVRSEPDGAAVWLLLGRSPMDSLALPASMIHELRIELDGHHPVDLQVAGVHWARVGERQVAALQLPLQLGKSQLPAVPPRPSTALAPGPAARGTIHVETTPPGAAVWLFVGVTGTMSFKGLEAGRDYELEVVKDGYLPGHVRIAAEEWRDGGDPRVPLAAAPKKAVIERTVKLIPSPRESKK